MSKHAALPWATDEHEHDAPYQEIEIRGADGRRICRIWMDDAPLPDYNSEQRANARHIVHCVNYHDRLREALEKMHAIAEFREARNPDVIAAGELLQELDNLEPKP